MFLNPILMCCLPVRFFFLFFLLCVSLFRFGVHRYYTMVKLKLHDYCKYFLFKKVPKETT